MNQSAPHSDRLPATPVAPIPEFSDADLAGLLKRVVRATALLGVAIALVLWLAMGWQTGALFAVGAALSIGSIYEWSRFLRHVTARLDGRRPGRSGFGTGMVVTFFLLRLMLFAAVIYGSLKCFHGSPVALLCGLGLALAGLLWQAMRLLRG